MRAITCVVALLGVWAIPASAQQVKRAFAPKDWYRVANVGSPSVSPDGQHVAFTVTTVKETENARHTEVWMVAAAGGEPVRLTSPAFSASNPRWSEDGKYLYFTSQRPGGRGSTWVLRMDQPYHGEAFQMEQPPSGSMPKDRTIVVSTGPASGESEGGEGGGRGGRGGGRGGSEQPQQGGRQGGNPDDPFGRMEPMARPPLGAITRPLDAARFDGRHIVEFPYKANGRGFTPNRREARRFEAAQIWVRQLSGDTARKMITNTAYSNRGATVSPDGKWIAFTADPRFRSDSVVQAERDSIARTPYNTARDEAPRNDADIFVIPVTGGDPRRLTSANGSEGGITWSPDSRQIAFTSTETRTSNTRLWIVDAAGGAPRNVLGTWKYEPGGIEWLPSGIIAMDASIGGRSAFFHVDPRTGKMTEVIGGRRRLSGFAYDAKRTKVAFVSTSIDQPTEIYIADIDGKNERKLTGINDALNSEVAWPTAERFTYTSVGGFEIEAWLQFPHGYQTGRKYPLVLYIHGGPHSAYGEGWFDEFHNLTGAGMFVLFTNPRGSSGYGADFTYATRGRWGKEDYEDLMKAVDIVARRPDVDSTRMGVTGGSYGGFMTAWVTTRTQRFKAAQADRMISNWISWYGTSEAQGLTEFEFYGKPWDNLALYEELSPIRYVQNVKTPTLIVQSEEDHRTPMTDAEQWFMSLKKQGVPVEFVRYPRSNHDLSRTGEPWLLVDRLGRLRQWFSHWLLGDAGVAADQSQR
jgi:dipeptidyl aminopeptidase/acylaminoacyl peptidase